MTARLEPLPSAGAEAARQLGLGVLVGMAATVFNAPFDVVKSRFQAQAPDSGGGGGGGGLVQQRKYTRVWSSLAMIAREEGWRALYRGFVPKALRLGIGQSVGLITFQRLLKAAGVAEYDDVEALEMATAIVAAGE